MAAGNSRRNESLSWANIHIGAGFAEDKAPRKERSAKAPKAASSWRTYRIF
jgi:hypothetical protein